MAKVGIVVKGLSGILITCSATILVLFTYMLLVDIQTEIPKDIKNEINIEIETFSNRNIYIITPNNCDKTDKTIVYIHGGSYIGQGTEEHWNFLEKLAVETKSTIIYPDYPLAPKYTYEEVSNIMIPLYKEIIEELDDIELEQNREIELILMGDSAGGGMALALVETMASEYYQIPDKTILISPWLDVRLTNPEINEVQKNDKQLNKETLKIAGLAYAGEDGINSTWVNPIDGNLSGINNVTILTGTYDILNPDVDILVQRASEVGTEIEVLEYEFASHVWMIEETSSKDLNEKGYQDIVEVINR